MNFIVNRIFPTIIALSALLITGCSAYFSIIGLSKLFAGAYIEVVIMSASLELAKIVTASLLYQYWNTISNWLKYYLIIATITLMIISSMGIYGFLSGAYKEVSNKTEHTQLEISILESKQTSYQNQKEILEYEYNETINTLSDLRQALSGNTIQYIDRETGQLINTTSAANRRSFETQLELTLSRQEELNRRLDNLNENILNIDLEVSQILIEDDLINELGPLIYLSDLLGYDMDVIVGILLVIIMFVFDPLAITLIIAANFAFYQLRFKKQYLVYNNNEELQEIKSEDHNPPKPQTPISSDSTIKDNNKKEDITDLFSTWRKNKILREKKEDNIKRYF
jgi:hypothetical protein